MCAESATTPLEHTEESGGCCRTSTVWAIITYIHNLHSCQNYGLCMHISMSILGLPKMPQMLAIAGC